MVPKPWLKFFSSRSRVSPRDVRRCAARGQALAELTIALVVLVILISGATTLANLCMKQELLQCSARLVAGEEAKNRVGNGVAEISPMPETRSDAFHQINALTYLERYSPALSSRLPISNYTLAAHDLPETDLRLKETTFSEIYFLDQPFIDLIYGKGTVTLRASVTFPAISNIW